MAISNRKSEHIKIAVSRPVSCRMKTSGLEAYDFVHNALPELDFREVVTRTEFLGKNLEFPLMISAMTGGYSGALAINRDLARACHQAGIALGVGSQRQILENNDHLDTYRIVRKEAPDAVIVGNVGAAQIVNLPNIEAIQRMVDLIEADAMAVHLNPLQELLQPEGDLRFRGVLEGIGKLVHDLSVPIIVKETGCGLSRDVALRLRDAGVTWVDAAGAGGTSWAGMESYRSDNPDLARSFWDWGIPTADSLIQMREIDGLKIIASGGIASGLDLAKCLSLGARIGGSALPLLKPLLQDGPQGLLATLDRWKAELKRALFLTGSRNVNELKRPGVLIKRQ